MKITQLPSKLDSLHSYKDACKILKQKQRKESDYDDTKEWYSHQLLTIIKAANFLDNNNEIWNADFDNRNTYKYIPYWIKQASGWVVDSVHCYHCSSHCSVGLYFKKEDTANVISKRFIDLYNKYMG